MKLVIGLGNPGSEYADTRHNIGFKVVDTFAGKRRAIEWYRRWQGAVAEASFAGEKVYILKPMTYMNNSGQAVAAAIRELNPSRDNILVVFDDLDLPLGALRFRRRGSDGGHKGMFSILQALGHQDIPRLRLGIGGDGDYVPREYVLQIFREEERQLAEMMRLRGAEAIDLWLYRGIVVAMNRFNGPQGEPPSEGEVWK